MVAAAGDIFRLRGVGVGAAGAQVVGLRIRPQATRPCKIDQVGLDIPCARLWALRMAWAPGWGSPVLGRQLADASIWPPWP